MILTFSSLLFIFIVRIQYKIHVTYKIRVSQLFLIRLLVNKKLLVVKYWGGQKQFGDF